MNRFKKAGLALLITSIFMSNTSMYAFANTVISVRRPAASMTLEEQSQTAPGPGAPGVFTEEPDVSPDNPEGTLPPQESAPIETAPIETPESTPAETPSVELPTEPTETEQTPEAEEPVLPTPEETGPLSVPKRVPRLQTTILLKDAMQWSTPFVNDQQVGVDNRGFSAISTFLEGIHGDLLYRTYTTSTGWTNWVMNGQQTELKGDWPLVEAIQFRFSGPVADQYDLYYTASLSDGSSTTWTKNGLTCGTMNQGLHMTGFRLIFKEKGTDPQLDLSYPVRSAHADGIQYIDGVMRYIHGDGSNFTGWAYDGDDRYYFVDSYPVTGWQYLDGYKYYFGEDGKMWSDLESLVGVGGPFMIRINKEMNCMTIYTTDGANGFIVPVKSFLTSTGDNTPLGTFRTPEKYRWRLMINDVWTQYATRLGSGLSILMHSIIYDRPDPYTVWASTYNNLGIARSAGCIRLTTEDSKWIYDHCPVGTTVEVYNSPIPGPYNRPTIDAEIPFEQRWDPTDPSLTPEGIEATRQAILAAHGIQ